MPIQYACDIIGITRTTYTRWMERGDAEADDEDADDDSPYLRFRMAVKKAYAEFVRDSRDAIRSGRSGWQGAAWWLERTNTFFMPKQQIQADDEGKVTVVIGGKSIPKGPIGNERR